MNSGIYKIHFIGRENSFYIGSAINISERKIRHKHHLKIGIHKNQHLQRLYNKHGSENIVFTTVEIVDDASQLIIREQYYMDILKPDINILTTAGSLIGFKHSEETKNYLRALHIGKKMTSEQNMKNSLAQKNLYANGYVSPNKGKAITDKQRIAISNAQSRKVIDTVTGEIFKSVRYASTIIGVKYETLYAKLSGRNNNNTNLKFY